MARTTQKLSIPKAEVEKKIQAVLDKAKTDLATLEASYAKAVIERDTEMKTQWGQLADDIAALAKDVRKNGFDGNEMSNFPGGVVLKVFTSFRWRDVKEPYADRDRRGNLKHQIRNNEEDLALLAVVIEDVIPVDSPQFSGYFQDMHRNYWR